MNSRLFLLLSGAALASCYGFAVPQARGQDPDEPRSWTCQILSAGPAESGNYGGELWPNGVVPYLFDTDLTPFERSQALAAMTELEGLAGIDFVERNGQSDYVLIVFDFFNASYVGRQGGQQVLSIYDWDERYVIAHELMHALGAHHEHQRPDRDQYIVVHTENFPPGCGVCEFNMRIEPGAIAHGPYDFESVMHYPQCAFSECFDCELTPVSCRTIEVLPPYTQHQTTIGNRTGLSTGDGELLRFLYPAGCGLELDQRVRVVNAGPTGIAVRSCASDACAPIGQRMNNATGVIRDGPTAVSGVDWWEIEWDDGLIGWSAERNAGGCLLIEAPPPPDATPPLVAIAAPLPNAVVADRNLTISGSAEDPQVGELPPSGIDAVEARVNGGVWQPATGTTTWTALIMLVEGANSIEARSRDRAGLLSTLARVNVTFVPPDVVPPLVVIVGPTSDAAYATTLSTLTLTGTASDQVGVSAVSWANDRGPSGAAQGTANWSAIVELLTGVNQITITGRDAAGNTATDMLAVTFTPPDVTAPTIEITTPSTAPTHVTAEPALRIAGTAADDVNFIEVTWLSNRGGRGIASGRTNWSASSVPLLVGENQITVTARDAAGNSASDTLMVSYHEPDRLPPSKPVSANALAASTGQVDLAWGAATDLGGSGVKEYRIYRDGALLTTTPATAYSDIGLTAGVTYCYTIEAFDGGGNPSGATEPTCVTTLTADGAALSDPNVARNDPLAGAPAGAGCGGTAAMLMSASLIGLWRTRRPR